ncbi:CBS domain-containing protein [Cyanobacterium stanieri LEGE 03274]|uniref:CBS domain-containing protein n=1 Tax=Cyanobacterium stanieri LEGE 03274 TaxID=1828756 RepID=A0ABR9V1H5_9CHRO|nr:CBS domain-containing protein [Cyanobacterium stanieri]MBE9221738.1 CBS domain-containing protein [Cyanobacterium stanieri LEGE 03274]
MDLILCHQTADFDTLGAAVGLSKIHPRAKIVLTGGAHPSVKNFLAFHRDELALIDRRTIHPEKIRHIFIVDTQRGDRIGNGVQWLSLPNVESVTIYDHHPENEHTLTATNKYIEKVGSTSTIICELLQKHNVNLNSIEATVMALGIHGDTGSLTFEQTTDRDALALAWLMGIGVNLAMVSEYAEPSLSPQLQDLLPDVLNQVETEYINESAIAFTLLKTPDFIPGLSSLVGRIGDLIEVDVLIFGHFYQQKKGKQNKLGVIGRSKLDSVNLGQIFAKYGGGGHSSAASFSIRCDHPQGILEEIKTEIHRQIPLALTAFDLMSSPVRTIRPQTTIEKAQRILLRYGHSGLFVVDQDGELVGVISRRDIDIALHHGFAHAPVKGYMSKNLHTITPDTGLSTIEAMMVNNDIGRLPVLDEGDLVGIVTRTDILRQLHQTRISKQPHLPTSPIISCLLPSFQERLHPPIWELLQQAARYAENRGWHLYLVGGGVRDLLLTGNNDTLKLEDIDLVVDGFHRNTTTEAGVALAQALQESYPQARLSIHGDFQTAALTWHNDDSLDSLWVDIATARTEFYPYPAANPEVEASSIRQDLYRRDFSINALAVRLTNPNPGELLDFFGGVRDVRSHLIRVLHPNSFIEDPTRIFRGVRFAVRLNFDIEAQTMEYIKYAIGSGIFEKVSLEKASIPALTTRLKAELSYILQANYWKKALKLLQQLGALGCIHPQCEISPQIWWQIRYLDRWLRYYNLEQENHKTPSWLLRLEIILTSLTLENRIRVAENLQLPKDSIQRLTKLEKDQEKIENDFNQTIKLSQKVRFFEDYKPLDLILIAVKSNKIIRANIWQYLLHWSKINSPINGNDLRALGYKPSPQYQIILHTVQDLFLDQKITNKSQAINFITEKFPP